MAAGRLLPPSLQCSFKMKAQTGDGDHHRQSPRRHSTHNPLNVGFKFGGLQSEHVALGDRLERQEEVCHTQTQRLPEVLTHRRHLPSPRKGSSSPGRTEGDPNMKDSLEI